MFTIILDKLVFKTFLIQEVNISLCLYSCAAKWGIKNWRKSLGNKVKIMNLNEDNFGMILSPCFQAIQKLRSPVYVIYFHKGTWDTSSGVHGLTIVIQWSIYDCTSLNHDKICHVSNENAYHTGLCILIPSIDSGRTLKKSISVHSWRDKQSVKT